MPLPILAATDFSPLADVAVERAALLARERRCPLCLLHVHNDFTWAHFRELMREQPGYDVEAAARARLRALAGDLAARHGLATVDSAIITGRASAGIAARAREIGAGLVVLGAHGAGLVRELALGGTAIKALRASPCPVLVARREARRAYARILVATDFSTTATRALRVALDTFPDAAHSVVHAYEVPYAGRMQLAAGASPEDMERYREQTREAARRQLDAFTADADYQAAGGVGGLARQGAAATVLLDEAMRADAELLVIGKHGMSALEERLIGSVTLNVLHHAPCDVLLVP